MNENFWIAFLMTAIAGLSTGIGSAIAFFAKKTDTKFLALALGFSAGVMIYVSMIEIFKKAVNALSVPFGEKMGTLVTLGGFFGGMLLIILIDKLLPERKFAPALGQPDNASVNKAKLLRSGVMTAVAIGIHNFPEGLATFVSALNEPTLAIPIVVAIAIHNIPEGMAVSIPIYYATGSKKKAFLYSFLSGVTEPVGALIGYLLLMPIMNDVVYGILFAAVAGIMIFISLEELLPSAREYGAHWLTMTGMICGMAIMGISLFLFM